MKDCNAVVVLMVLLGVLCFEGSVAKESPPKVQVYSRKPGEYGKENILICHVNGFHPPEITIELLQGEKEMSGSEQSDLAFEESWFYHLTKHAHFTPTKGEEYACRVKHLGQTKTYVWESDM